MNQQMKRRADRKKSEHHLSLETPKCSSEVLSREWAGKADEKSKQNMYFLGKGMITLNFAVIVLQIATSALEPLDY